MSVDINLHKVGRISDQKVYFDCYSVFVTPHKIVLWDNEDRIFEVRPNGDFLIPMRFISEIIFDENVVMYKNLRFEFWEGVKIYKNSDLILEVKYFFKKEFTVTLK